MSAATKLPVMTAAEFLNWDAPDGSDRWELVEGIPRAMSPSSPRHGAIHAQAVRVLAEHLERQRPGCRVLIEAGVQPRGRSAFNVRVPDLSVTCEQLDKDARLLREPLVLIEVLSPSNANDTWANVTSYETIPSVAAVLVLHGDAVRGHLLVREAGGQWPADPVALGPDGLVVLDCIGFEAPIAAFYRTAGLT
jgi:Uma2 family endonuclease